MNLNIYDFAALSPLLIVLAGAVLLLLLESFAAPRKAKKFAAPLTLAMLAAALTAVTLAPASDNILLTPWLRFDHLAKFFTTFFLIIAFASILLACTFFHYQQVTSGEYFFLLLSALFGLLLVGAAADFLTLFLGLETLSISLYVLCGYIKKWTTSHESAIKYFLIGSLAAAFLLYGIALIYGATGTTGFATLLTSYQGLTAASDKTLFLAGIAFVTVGLAFKAAIVPFHTWAPDVYEGAPTPVTAFMAVGTKVGAFAAFAIIFLLVLPKFHPLWNSGIALLAVPTLIYANAVALRQTQLRRFFAYSGISHAGFLLIPLAAGGVEALPSLLFYLVVYAAATLGAFGIIAFLDNGKESLTFTDLHGLFRRSPLLAALLALCLLTLAGIPPTAGFFAKFYIFKVAFQGGYYTLVIVGLLTTILSAYYYLRIIAIMLREASVHAAEAITPHWPAAYVAACCAVVIGLLSCFPEPLLSFLNVNVKTVL